MSNKDILDLVEEGKIKRYFRVNEKIIVENGIYHITQRAPGIEKIFLEESDYLYFLKLLKETVFEFKLKLFAFALLPNHFHFLLQIRDKNLPKAMKSLLERYAMFFNKKYKRKGHVFGGRYRAALCNDEIYLLAISLYIHLNPFKGGLCKKVENYRWLSLRPYLEGLKSDTFVDYRCILEMLDNDLGKARQAYRDLLYKSSNVSYEMSLEKPNATENFLLKISNFIKNLIVRKSNDVFYFEEVLNSLKEKKRLNIPQEREARRYLINQLKSRGYRVKEIASILNVSRQTIYATLT